MRWLAANDWSANRSACNAWCLLAVVIAFLFASDSSALELDRLFKNKDQRAIELLNDGQNEAAANEFNDTQWRGISRYRAGQYEQAMQDFSASEDAIGLYNYGTAAVRNGAYEQAVEILQQAQQLAPDNQDISHNLDLAMQLRDLSQQQQQEQQQQGDEQQQSESDAEDQNSDEAEPQDNPSDQEQQSQQGDESSESDNSQSSQQNQDESQQNESESQDGTNQTSQQQQQAEEDLREMMQPEGQPEGQQEQQQEQPDEEQQQAAASVPESVSEDDQATEQWLRRIPDDASQLLRNKIRLNHLIEYPEVQDMQEPW